MTPKLLFGDTEHEGLASYITVMGDDGKINLNTAPSVVLQALAPEMTRKLAQELIDFREDPRQVKLLSNPDWYRQVSGFPGGINFNGDLLTVTGKYFMVRVNATINQYSRTGTGVLLRNDEQQLPLLLWKLE
jgi:general secretion pathway protein K